jgi:hypothetical protein
MPKSKAKARKKNVKTRFGIVDLKVFEDLRDRYDTWALLGAIDAVDQVRYRDDEIREGLMAVHGMAMNIINDNHAAPGGRVPDEPIGELADRLACELQECINYLEKAYEAVYPLSFLIGNPDEESAEWKEWVEEGVTA